MIFVNFEAPKSLLETTLNTRDLGIYQSEISGKSLKKWNILRSDVQNSPSERDIEVLKNKNICTIIDMRGEKEVQRTPSGFLDREGFTYFNIPIEEGSGIPESVDKVSESYMTIAEGASIVQVFQTIAAAPGGVMINCTAGKDRTGVVSAILLGICGVSDENIIYDYVLTKAYSRERFEAIRQNFPDIDMNIVIPSERYMAEFILRLREKYRDFREYLAAVGVTGEEIERICAKLMG